ncbi:cupin domain-containing protein [Streptomyces sp. NPDC004561]
MIRNRRVVTGHDADGRSCVIFDSSMDTLPVSNSKVALVWTTDAVPASNEGSAETCATPVDLDLFNGDGAKFVLFEMEPGDEIPMHQTTTIDYAVVIRGQVLLTLESGSVVMGPGDVMVDRGALHAWGAHGDEPAVMAATLIPAKPLS